MTASTGPLSDAAATGDRLTILQVLRDRLAADLDETHDPREIAALALRFTDVLTQLDQMPKLQKVSAADEIAERRATRRRSRTKNPARAPRTG